jgi:hypothetical protein
MLQSAGHQTGKFAMDRQAAPTDFSPDPGKPSFFFLFFFVRRAVLARGRLPCRFNGKERTNVRGNSCVREGSDPRVAAGPMPAAPLRHIRC